MIDKCWWAYRQFCWSLEALMLSEKAWMSMPFSFLMLTVTFALVGSAKGNVESTTKWSLFTVWSILMLSTGSSQQLVMTWSSVLPFTSVATLICCSRLKDSRSVENCLAAESSSLSRWKLTSLVSRSFSGDSRKLSRRDGNFWRHWVLKGMVTHDDFRKVLAETQIRSHEHLRLDTQFIIYRGTCSCVYKYIQRKTTFSVIQCQNTSLWPTI